MLKWELRRLYYSEHQYYDEHGYFTDDFLTLKGEFEYSVDPMIEITKHTFEITCRSRDKKRELYILSDGKTGTRGDSY